MCGFNLFAAALAISASLALGWVALGAAVAVFVVATVCWLVTGTLAITTGLLAAGSVLFVAVLLLMAMLVLVLMLMLVFVVVHMRVYNIHNNIEYSVIF